MKITLHSPTKKNRVSNFRKSLSIVTVGFAMALNSFGQGPEILHYQFNGTGSIVPNLASAPPVGTNNATIMGVLTQGNTGQCGTALIGSGVPSSTDYLNTAYAPALGTGSWTISMWTSNITASSTLFYIFGDANTNSFRCFTNGVAGANNWIIRGGGLTDLYVNGGATVAPHVTTFVYDQTVNTLYGYLDGALVSTVVQSTPNISGAGPFKVMGYGTNVGSPAGGLLDEFRMYSRALSAAEVMALTGAETTSSLTILQCGDYTSPSGNYIYTSSGTYMDTIPNAFGCDSIITLNLTLTQPVITANVSQPIVCLGEPVTLYGSGGSTYNWSGGITDNSPFTPTTGGYYVVDGIDTNGCLGIDSLLITVNPVPTVIGNMDQTICMGDTITLYGSGADTYTWTGGITDNTPFVPSGSTVYTVTGTDANGCSAIDDVTITVNAASASTITEVSIGSYTLNGQVYTSSGTYTQLLTNANGCDSTITLNLTISASSIDEQSTYFSVYPNPTNGSFTLHSNSLLDTPYSVVDVKGRNVITGKITGEETVVNGASLPAGVYQIVLENGARPIKLIVR